MPTRSAADQNAQHRRPTLKDVALAAGVDASLVSRVVNNDPKASASPATRQRILDVVEQLGYRASPLARGLRMARSWTLGFLLPDFDNPLYSSMVKGIETRAASLGYGLVLGGHNVDHREDTITRLLQQQRVDGLLAASGMTRDSAMREVASVGPGPVVMVNRRVRGLRASVIVDDEAGARLAVEHLAAQGHKSIVGLFGPGFIDTTQRRRRGFEGACHDHALQGQSIEMDAWNPEAGREGALRTLVEMPQATAIFASTFLMGLGALSGIRSAGLSVPEDLSLISLHDSALAEYLAPPLTTVAMPTEQMGAEAVSLLVSMLDGRPPRHIVLRDAPALVLRRSTGPAPSHQRQSRPRG